MSEIDPDDLKRQRKEQIEELKRLLAELEPEDREKIEWAIRTVSIANERRQWYLFLTSLPLWRWLFGPPMIPRRWKVTNGAGQVRAIVIGGAK